MNRCTHLPEKIWYESDPKAHDQRLWGDVLAVLKAGSLLIFDKGYITFSIFDQLSQSKIKFITRAKTNLVWIGKEETHQKIRLIEVQYRGKVVAQK